MEPPATGGLGLGIQPFKALPLILQLKWGLV